MEDQQSGHAGQKLAAEIISMKMGVSMEYAAFIVRACNSHYELLEALKGAAGFILCARNNGEAVTDDNSALILNIIDNILKKAEADQ